jgi:hypothetical protein
MSLPNWKRAERVISLISGGKITPGSGNGWEKGDVIVEDLGLAIEVKYSSQPTFTLKYEWFTKLERERGKDYDLCLALFHGQLLVAYVQEPFSCFLFRDGWRTTSCRVFEDFPATVCTTKSIWRRVDADQLRLLFIRSG